MFDIGWTEMALIAVVAVIVIGPKELPKVMRELGVWVGRARGMSRVFMQQLEEMSRQAGIDEVRKEAEALRQLNPTREIEKVVDPEGLIARQADDLAKIGTTLEPPRPTPADPSAPSGEAAASQPPTPTIETPAIEQQPSPETAEPAKPAAAPVGAPRGPGDSAP